MQHKKLNGNQKIVEATTPLNSPSIQSSIHHNQDEITKEELEINLQQNYDHCQVLRRNGEVAKFDIQKIVNAICQAYCATTGKPLIEPNVLQEIEDISRKVVAACQQKHPLSYTFNIEEIQDQVELALMRHDNYEFLKVAKSYMIYRADRHKKRQAATQQLLTRQIHVIDEAGSLKVLDVLSLQQTLEVAAVGLDVDIQRVLNATLRDLYDNILSTKINEVLLLNARSLIERDVDYSKLAARLLLNKLFCEVIGTTVTAINRAEIYKQQFHRCLQEGVDEGLYNSALLTKFNVVKLAKALKEERDRGFEYLGLQTLYDRYFTRIIHGSESRIIELPQIFFMRVAMGLALNEKKPTERAIEFYNLLSSFRFMSSTPTLFNSGTTHSQLSSCYLTTVADDLSGIFGAYQENALLAKYAGGLGNDWTPVRAMGSYIKGTNGKSQGVIPFLKIVNDTAVAVNQGGKRKGAVCSYLETWHLDVEEFLELRKNTGDERRRTHDMNTANWIPDLFMKRMLRNEKWTLFSPCEVPDLHDLYGEKFEKAYCEYERKFAEGSIRGKRVEAKALWRKMLTMLYETGHPWITFKDPCNVRSPQNHAGVVHSSNLCTEITLNTNDSEIAVCNLGSVNLPAHYSQESNQLDEKMIEETVRTAMRMLDNVIDINFYAVDKAKNSNMKHRPVGLGMMGFQDCLSMMDISYSSDEAVKFADRSTEAICYYAYWASSDLAAERGSYESFAGSYWDRGVLPLDSLRVLAQERSGEYTAQVDDLSSGTLVATDAVVAKEDRIDTPYLKVDSSSTKDWGALRDKIKRDGMRNSNCVAIAPTATIANIVGVCPSIEPNYQNIYVKSNLSGDFTICNEYLIKDLKKCEVWDDAMIEDIKFHDGRIDKVERIPEWIKHKHMTTFDIETYWLVEAAARRQKWIDQAQSLNLYFRAPSGKDLHDAYLLAWMRGLKTTYYLRSLGISSTEKYTSRAGAHNDVAISKQ